MVENDFDAKLKIPKHKHFQKTIKIANIIKKKKIHKTQLRLKQRLPKKKTKLCIKTKNTNIILRNNLCLFLYVHR